MERDPRLRVERGESATGWWEFVRGRADPRLEGIVSGLCGYRERASTAVSRRMAATTRVPIILSFGEPLDVTMSPGPDGGDGTERRYATGSVLARTRLVLLLKWSGASSATGRPPRPSIWVS